MATLGTTYRHTIKYTAKSSNNTDPLSRTISGLNFGATAGSTETGPSGTAVTDLINTLDAFSIGILSDFRYIVERPVIL